MNFKHLLELAKSEIAWMSTLDDPDLRLEQVEFNEKESLQTVTVSFLVERKNPFESPNPHLLPKYERIYKQLLFDKEDTVRAILMFDSH